MGFIPQMQEWSNICEILNAIYHISKMKDKNYIIFSIDAESI